MELRIEKEKQISISAKLIIVLGIAIFLAVCCLAVLFVKDHISYVSNRADDSEYTHFTAEMLSEYNPYGYSKNYLAVSESKGFSIELFEPTNVNMFEIVIEGQYNLEYYLGHELIGEDRLFEDNERIICNQEDLRKKVMKVPDQVACTGFDRIIFEPYAGNGFSLSYFSLLKSIEDNAVLQQTEEMQVTRAYLGTGTGSQYDVQGMFAYLKNWDESKINLQLESATTKLDMELLRIENEAGDVLTEFPEESTLPKAVLIDSDNTNNTLLYKEYSLPLMTHEYFPDDVYICYRYEKGNEIKRQKVNPFAQINEEIYQGTQIRTQDNMSSFLNLRQENGKVFFTDDYVVLDKALFIPKGFTFVIKEGQTIDLHNDAFIISRSALVVEGNKQRSAKITTSDNSKSAGIAVIQAESRSICNYLVCDNLGELSSGIYHLTGAVTFYESDVDFYNCEFLNNRSEDGLNTVRSDIYLKNCTFKNTFQDAFDSDFCQGTFDGCYFEATGNDAFDVSTSKFTVINTSFKDIHDKAISAGEASTVEVVDMYAENVQIGIGAKDNSVVTASNVTIKNAFIGFCSYQKKPEFGPCIMTIDEYSLEGSIDFRYLIEENDKLVVNGQSWEAMQKQKQALIIEKMINEEPIK